jgi:hypothetical protein
MEQSPNLAQYDQPPEQEHDENNRRQPELLPIPNKIPEIAQYFTHQNGFSIRSNQSLTLSARTDGANGRNDSRYLNLEIHHRLHFRTVRISGVASSRWTAMPWAARTGSRTQVALIRTLESPRVRWNSSIVSAAGGGTEQSELRVEHDSTLYRVWGF